MIKMDKKKLRIGLYEIGLYLYEISDVSDDDETTDENRHIKFMYEVLDELTELVEKIEE